MIAAAGAALAAFLLGGYCARRAVRRETWWHAVDLTTNDVTAVRCDCGEVAYTATLFALHESGPVAVGEFYCCDACTALTVTPYVGVSIS